MMMRRVLAAALGLTLTLTAAVWLVRAGGAPAAEVRDMLQPPGCPSPCWAGIRPGETPAQTARDLLSAHPWVGAARGTRAIAFGWSGRQPDVIDARREAVMVMRDDHVHYVALPTRIPLGEVLALLGMPRRVGWTFDQMARKHYSLGYPHLHLEVFFVMDSCRLKYRQMLTLWATLYWSDLVMPPQDSPLTARDLLRC